MIEEKHGVANARQVASGLSPGVSAVTVTDCGSEVQLYISSATYAAGMTPEQARFVARQLVMSAGRAERRAKAEGGTK